MTRLAPDLLDTDFGRLTDAGRALIPQYAPTWTDHNIHDPGIMLIELLAWLAESQIYSLARLRGDERRAYAALFGVAANGAVPARAALWPDAPLAGQIVPALTPVTLQRIDPVPFVVSHRIGVSGATVARLETVAADGAVTDQAGAAARDGAEFAPFGADGTGTFVIALTGPLLPPDPGGALLSLGVLVADRGPLPADRRARLVATLVAAGVATLLRVVDDDTAGLGRSGTIVLGPPPAVVDAEIRLRAVAPVAVAPRVQAIALNVLPVVQTAAGSIDAPAWPVAVPGRTIVFPPAPAGDLVGDPVVTVGPAAWRRVDGFDDCGPDDTVFTVDPVARAVRFGNDVNGAIPRDRIVVDYSTTRGADGNLPAGSAWRVAGMPGWTNRAGAAGGAAARDLDDLRRAARHALRDDHILVTAADLAAAALAETDLDLARAEPRLAADGTRRLIVLRARTAADAPGETRAWRAEIARRLRPRLPLGDRLAVVAPAFVALTVTAGLVATAGADPAAIAAAARDMLAAWLATLPADGRPGWALGKAVDTADVRARLRRLPGVARVTACTVDPAIPIGPTALPVLTADRTRITVVRATGGGR